MKQKKNEIQINNEWIDIGIEMKASRYEYNLPLVPFDLWQQACSFMKWVSDNNNSEAIVSMTLIGDEWKIICWHQEPRGSLHVKFNVEEERNQELLDDELREALKNIHCTIHSHNKAGAGQSGDDADDELQKIGWHITVGNLDQDKMSTHARFNLQQNAIYKDGVKIQAAYQQYLLFDAVTVVEPMDLNVNKKQKNIITKLHKEFCESTPTGDLFPEEWKERIHKTEPVSYTRPSTKKPGFQGLATNMEDFWEEPEWIEEWPTVANHDEAFVMLEELFKRINLTSVKIFTFGTYHEKQFTKELNKLNKQQRFNFTQEALEVIADQSHVLAKFCVKKEWNTSKWHKNIEPFIEDERDKWSIYKIQGNQSVRDAIEEEKESLQSIKDQVAQQYGQDIADQMTESDLKAWSM